MGKSLAAILFSFFLCASAIASENHFIDSLTQVLENSPSDSAKVSTLNHLSFEYLKTDADKALQNAVEALELSKKIENKILEADALTAMGNAMNVKSEYQRALSYYEASLKLNQALDRPIKIAGSYNNIGSVYTVLGNYEAALGYQMKSLAINEKHGSESDKAKNLLNIGLIYERLGNHMEAKSFMEQTYELAKQLADHQLTGVVLVNLGIIYQSSGEAEKALDTYFLALESIEKANDKKAMAACYRSISTIYSQQGDLGKALEFAERSLELRKLLKERRSIAISLTSIGDIYLLQDEHSKAIPLFKEAISIASEVKAKAVLRYSYQSLSRAYYQLGNLRKAYAYQEAFSLLSDSLKDEQQTKQIAEMQAKYDLERKDKEIELLSKESEIAALKTSRKNNIIFGLIGAILLMVLIGFLLFKQNQLKAEQKAVSLEKKLLRSQMNPHFIFNALNAIQNYILKKDTKESAKYMVKFAALMRAILENSREDFIPLNNEIETIENYLELQQLRFDNRFDYTINTSENLEPSSYYIPPMLLQPFIENALEHGIQHSTIQGKLGISFQLEEPYIRIDITDNGIGRKKAEELKKRLSEKHKSLATRITQERIFNFNRKRKRKIKIKIRDLYNKEGKSTGTKVTFKIPYKIS